MKCSQLQSTSIPNIISWTIRLPFYPYAFQMISNVFQHMLFTPMPHRLAINVCFNFYVTLLQKMSIFYQVQLCQYERLTPPAPLLPSLPPIPIHHQTSKSFTPKQTIHFLEVNQESSHKLFYQQDSARDGPCTIFSLKNVKRVDLPEDNLLRQYPQYISKVDKQKRQSPDLKLVNYNRFIGVLTTLDRPAYSQNAFTLALHCFCTKEICLSLKHQ